MTIIWTIEESTGYHELLRDGWRDTGFRRTWCGGELVTVMMDKDCSESPHNKNQKEASSNQRRENLKLSNIGGCDPVMGRAPASVGAPAIPTVRELHGFSVKNRRKPCGNSNSARVRAKNAT